MTEIHADLPLDERPWQIGLITGPSGSGKSTLARALYGEGASVLFPPGVPIIESFPPDIETHDIAKALGAVGLNSIPTWLRPYEVCSTGERFRAQIARLLLEGGDLVVLDEFSSVVDRQVAKIVSHCTQKWVRRCPGKQFVAVTCHEDVLDWLQPDWVYYVHRAAFEWRCLCPRPRISISIHEADRSYWPMFARHHYLTGELHPAAKCFVACVDGQPVAFSAYIQAMGHPGIKRGHRRVVLPDWQGLGIGTSLACWLGEYLQQRGLRFSISTANPGFAQSLLRSGQWDMYSSADGRRPSKKIECAKKDLYKRAFHRSPRKICVRNLMYRGLHQPPVPEG